MTQLAYCGIDWLTYSFNRPAPVDGQIYEELLLLQADEATREHLSQMVSAIGFKPNLATSHRPYNQAISPCDGIVTMWSMKRPEAIAEIQGTACRLQPERARAIAEAVRERITRIDLCADFETQMSPKEATKESEATTRSEMTSNTGQTVYLGSPTSERYVRVYRYAPPHPRAQFLRVEIVYRRDYAKRIIGVMQEQGIQSIVKSEIERLKIDYRLSQAIIEASAEYQLTRRGTQGEEKTVLWLAKQVAPAIKRLIDEGYPEEELRNLLGL